jgi:hypothetical protein
MALRRTRPNRILIPAGIACLVFALTTWAADPAWARSAGLDVWNVGRLENDLRHNQAEYLKLEARHELMLRQFEQNDLLVRDVFAGRRPLAEAAEVLWEANQEMPGFVAVLQVRYRGPSTTAKAAHNILERIAMGLDFPADRKAREFARLRAEYTAAFGIPAPECWQK